MTQPRQGQTARPLLPGPARRPAAIVLAFAVLIVAGGAVLVHDDYNDPLDGRIDLWAVARLGGHGEALRLVADLGQEVGIGVIIAGLVLACLAARRVNGALLALVGAPAASVATEKVLKPLAGHLFVYSTYPSGHTTGFFALIATIAVLLAGPPGGRVRPAVRIAILTTALLIGCAIGCAIGLAVVALSDHRFIDTVAGAAVGIAVTLTATFVLDLPVSRRLIGLAHLSRRPPALAAPDTPEA